MKITTGPMKSKIIVVALILTIVSISSFYYYKYFYVSTLMLSEVVGKTNNSGINVAVNFFDFDTGLTRHDIRQLKKNKDYWIRRIKEVDAIQNSDQKRQASLQLLSDMMDDPTLKKLAKIITSVGLGVTSNLLETISD